MAIQEGIIPLSGKMGDVIFSNRKGKKYARAKSSKPMNQTAATKKSSSDFGEASKMGARIRKAFAPLINRYGDNTAVTRFTKHILKVFKTIPAANLGLKNLWEGDISVFKDFQFNALARLNLPLNQEPKVKLDTSGLKIAFPGNWADGFFKWPVKANAVVLQLMVYNLNLNSDDDEVVAVKDLLIPLDSEHFRGAKLLVPLNFKGEQVVWVALGMHFLDKNNSMIGDKTKRAASIVYVARLSDGEEVAFVSAEPVLKQDEKGEGTLEWDLE